ncbi:unnamed protein product [Symbiodinium sp. CCMP2456]|nr:unnamed protein product [Symbiodinium sp. CCMP2456]
MAPLATTIVPDSGLRDISIDVSEATVRFNEPVNSMAIREATLYQLDPNNGPERYNEAWYFPRCPAAQRWQSCRLLSPTRWRSLCYEQIIVKNTRSPQDLPG